MDVIARNNVHVLDTEGPVLLYAHGFGCHQHMWSRITPAFLQSHRQEKWPRVSSRKFPLVAGTVIARKHLFFLVISSFRCLDLRYLCSH